MCRLKWKVLIVAFILSAGNLPRIDANSNVSSYYRSPNVTTTTTPTIRHYAIINGSDTILDTTAKYGGHAVTETGRCQNIVASEGEAAGTVENGRRIVSPTFESHLERSSVIFGLTKVANASNLNVACHKQLKHIQRGILHKEPWAMKVLDASGTKPSGFVFGQNYWLGSREACGAVQNPVAITLSKNFQRVMQYGIITQSSPFDMDYKVVYLSHNSPWQVEIKLMSEQIIHIGLCLPSSCGTSEIQQLTADYIASGLFVENEIYDIRPQVLYMKDLELSDSFYQKRTFKMFGAFVAFTAAMMMCASFLRSKPIAEKEAVTKAVKEKPESDNSAEAMTAPTGEPTPETNDTVSHKLKNFANCFDVNANCEKMFATKESAANEIPIINGLRSVSSIWIMLFHVLWYMYFTVNNKTFLISFMERVLVQYISSAPLLVDAFFTISGFLQTYNFLRNAKQMEIVRQNSFGRNAKLFFKMLSHRYLRLAPLYIVIMGAVDLVYAYIGDVSVYHIPERVDEICSQYWWRNLLFIQNFFDHNDMCLNWTWSLACEMQFFILATILLFTYVKHPKFVKCLVAAAFVGSMAWTYVVGLNIQFQLSFDVAFATGTHIYINPFIRILPYIMGALAAWYLLEKQSQFDLSEMKEKCLWNLAILLFILCIYSTIKRDMSYFSTCSLFVIGRFFFSGSICWMILGSVTGSGTWWSRLLEAKTFQHLNRLSYGIYLLNPIVIVLVFSLTNVSANADPFMMVILTTGFAVIVYLASIVFSLAFEMPYSNWSSQLLKRSKQKSA